MRSFESVAKILLLSLIVSFLLIGSAFSADRSGSLSTALAVSDRSSGPITVDTHPWDREGGGGGGNSEELLPLDVYSADDLESAVEDDTMIAPDMETIYITLFEILSSAR